MSAGIQLSLRGSPTDGLCAGVSNLRDLREASAQGLTLYRGGTTHSVTWVMQLSRSSA